MAQLKDYKLPVQNKLRNFPNVEKKQWYSLAELQEGDLAGTTETDSKTAPESGGYTYINKKSGKGYIIPIKASSPRAKDN